MSWGGGGGILYRLAVLVSAIDEGLVACQLDLARAARMSWIGPLARDANRGKGSALLRAHV